MVILLYGMILFFVSLLLNFPMTRKALSEDDGNWYYLAVFWKKGVRLFREYNNYGYFGIPLLSAVIYNLFNFKKLSFFYYFKIVWYGLTAVSIYWMVLSFWQNITLAFLAGLIFAIVTAVPSTFFVMTYGEHFFLLPINLSIVCAYYGITSGNAWHFLMSGVMSAWAVQVKPTALLFSLLMPLVFYWSQNSVVHSAFYLLGLVGLSLSPIVIIKLYGGFPKQYLRSTFFPVVELINLWFIKKNI